MAESKNIYQRMLAAMAEIGTVKKDKRNTHQNYEYVSEEAIKTAAHKALVANGILFTLEGIGHEYLPLAKGGMSKMQFRYRFTNVDAPTEQITGEWESAAADASDKSHTKAITYAIREILKSNFVISTGEPDPDGDTPEVTRSSQQPRPASDPATEKQITMLAGLKEQLGLPPLDLEKVGDMSKQEASKYIKQFMAKLDEKKQTKAVDAATEVFGG